MHKAIVARVVRLIPLSFLVTVSATVRSEAQSRQPGPPDFRLVQVVPGVYATIEPRELALSPLVHGNSMFVVNTADVFAVDASRTPAAARKTIELLRTVTPLPVRQLMLTHFHGDHTLGTQAFVAAFPGIDVIATDSTRLDIIRTIVEPFAARTPAYYTAAADRYDSLYNAGVDMSGRPLTPARREMFQQVRNLFRNYYAIEAASIKPVAPNLTFDHQMTIHSGSRTIDLIHFGRGDTRGDAIAWLPTERVLAAGDALVYPVPYAGSRYPSEWVETLRAMKRLAPLHIVPGHGEVQNDTRYLDLVIETLSATIAAVYAGVTDKLTLDEIQKKVTMDQFRGRFVAASDPAVADRWDDFVGQLIPQIYAEATGKK